MKASIEATLVRSSGRYSILTPSATASAVTRRPPASSTSPMSTLAPSRASRKAVALPIPEEPPVTMMVRPGISIAANPSTIRPQCRRASPVNHSFLLQRVDDDRCQLMCRQIELASGRPCVPPYDIVAGPLFEAKMVERVRQAREVVAVERQHTLMAASLQLGQQDLQHFI